VVDAGRAEVGREDGIKDGGVVGRGPGDAFWRKGRWGHGRVVAVEAWFLVVTVGERRDGRYKTFLLHLQALGRAARRAGWATLRVSGQKEATETIETVI
jgi:hypothetical protein